ncbi:MAG: PKD domain-containing protein [Saprospiraceae bacterium]
MYIKFFILFLISLNISINLLGQKEDYHWIIGDDTNPTRIDTLFGNSSFNFNYEPVKIYHETLHQINMAGGNATLCDKDGNLLLYSNGQVIINGKNEFIEDTINYDHSINPNCNEWEYNNSGDNNMAIPTGLLLVQRIIFTPIENKIIAIYNTRSYCTKRHTYRVAFSLMVKSDQKPYGEIFVKDSLVYSKDTLISSLQAIRHGNGRDWWVVTFTDAFENLITFLVTETGVVFHQKVKTGYTKIAEGTLGQIVFSPNGKHLALYTGNKLISNKGGGFCIWDFDRCSGEIKNFRSIVSPQYGVALGAAFSSDSQYLYISNGTHLKQYDHGSTKFKMDEKTVAIIDSFYYAPDPNPNNIKTYVNFDNLKLGPDGKIYIFTSAGTQRYMSYMDFPYERYDQVGVRQHAIYMPRLFTSTVPNIPEFRLGPDDGSPCDTLGLDNHPVAKFRYEPDSNDYKRIRFTDLSYFRPETWSWDFGDGSPRVTEKYPFHTYAQNGTYEVCLTVSNENNSHTTCRTVTIGTSSSEDAGKKADITLFPNPVADILLVTLGEYIPQHGIIHIHDATGREVMRQRLYYGHNNIDLSSIPAGLYFWTGTDNGILLQKGKVLKM